MAFSPPEDDRPLTARSVMASALLGETPPQLPVSQLIRIGALFGLSENRARVALSRMVAAGELTTDQGRYRLHSPALLSRQERQRRSLEGTTSEWNGVWHMVVITAAASSAADRAARRLVLTKARLAEQRDGVWLRPDNLGDRLRSDLSVVDGELQTYASTPKSNPCELAAALWPLEEWARRASQLLDRLNTVSASSSDDLASGFVLSASVLRHLQGDPLLPKELLPRSWPGERLRTEYDGWNRRYRQLLRELSN